VERVEDLAVRGSLAREGDVGVEEVVDLEKKKRRKSIFFFRDLSAALGGGGSVVAAASFLQAGTVVAASAHECGLFCGM
jgi:hypothetical protein